ncbi:protein kinase [Streptomyces sp. NPDC006879]|uniref:serine/threonine protein kinase n=1 Tax=Streptomyces sp. NPDC006879 TaxID=3364767 RepID=UPI003687AD14
MNTWKVPGYTETRELGAGAGGRVVLAVHEATGVAVAVKYLAEHLRTDQRFTGGFRTEAELLGALESPYVVRLYEYVESARGAAIVMELVDGVALRALLVHAGRTQPEPALLVLKGSLLGLAAAHRAGVVHRDYKPENVLVAADGSSKLVDFGIAASEGSTKGVAGTPAYMAPEQWRGAPASAATDVYAATAVFYECLTGRKPYSGGNFAELALQHVSAPVPLGAVPQALQPLVRRGLAKDAAERPADAEAFVAELTAIAGEAYGPHWEERGQRRLAALAALVPLLFPSAAGPPAGGSSSLAATTLRNPGRGGLRPGRRGLLATGAALVTGGLLLFAAQASGGELGGRSTSRSFATTVAGTARPTDSPAADVSPRDRPTPWGPVEEPPAPTNSPAGVPTGTAHPSATPGATPSAPPAWSVPSPAEPAASTPSASSPTDTPPSTTSAIPSPSPHAEPATPSPGGGSPSPPVQVLSSEVTSLRQTGPSTADATFTVTANDTRAVVVTVQWFSGNAQGGPGAPDGPATTYRRSGAVQYRLSSKHTFRDDHCHWAVRISTVPAADPDASWAQIATRRCELR